MTEWAIMETSNGEHDVSKDRRAFRYGVDLDEAKRAIRKSRFYEPGDKVVLVDLDGFRTKVKL
jgi:hypothetical protein